MDVFEIGGSRFIAAEDMIVKHVRRFEKPFEPLTRGFIRDALDADDGAFVDVGASTGWYTVPAALAGHTVYAFEPNARVVERLRANLELNGIAPDLVKVISAAASWKEGETTFYYNPLVPLTSGGSIEHATCSGPLRETVSTVKLDDVIDEPVALIKIDVEGHERHVLDGAGRLIETYRPPLVLEANTEGFEAALALWLDRAGYDYTKADDRNMLCTPRSR